MRIGAAIILCCNPFNCNTLKLSVHFYPPTLFFKNIGLIFMPHFAQFSNPVPKGLRTAYLCFTAQQRANRIADHASQKWLTQQFRV